jgi:uncharacterized phage protein gp47/JayE
MKPEFTATGIQVQTYQEIFDELAANYRLIYGDDINIDTNTPDGQRIAIEAQARLDLQTFGLTLYQQLDPDYAFGTAQNRLIKLSGISRRPGTRSQVDVEITTDRPVALPADYAVEDTAGQAWTTLTSVDIPLGISTVTLFATVFGTVSAGAGTVTEPVTFVTGVLSVTNPLAATIGVDEETAAELRVRRNRSLENPSTSTIGGIFTALTQVSGVTDLAAYENDTDIYDAVLDIDPHTLWLIVEGGAVDDIVEAITKNKTGGTGLKGLVAGDYVETLYKPNGDPYIITHSMLFDRPTEIPLYINVTVTRKNSLIPSDVTSIENALVARPWTINENALASELYSTVYATGNTFIATDLEVSLDGITYVATSVETAADEKFIVDAANITVTEVI